MNISDTGVHPQFRAKFVPKVRLNRERWEKIAEKFEQRTKNYPNERFYMTDDDVRGSYIANKNGIEKKYYDIFYYFSTNKKYMKKEQRIATEWLSHEIIGNLLANYTDSEIASKLVKIFKLCKIYEESIEKLLSYAKKGKYKNCKEVKHEFDKKMQQYFQLRKKCYERDNVLESAANVYDKFILG